MFDSSEYEVAMKNAVARFENELKKSALDALIPICSVRLKSRLTANLCH